MAESSLESMSQILDATIEDMMNNKHDTFCGYVKVPGFGTHISSKPKTTTESLSRLVRGFVITLRTTRTSCTSTFALWTTMRIGQQRMARSTSPWPRFESQDLIIYLIDPVLRSITPSMNTYIKVPTSAMRKIVRWDQQLSLLLAYITK